MCVCVCVHARMCVCVVCGVWMWEDEWVKNKVFYQMQSFNLPGSCTSLALALLGHRENKAPEGWDFSTQLEVTNTPLSSHTSLTFRPSQKAKRGFGVLSHISCQMGKDLLHIVEQFDIQKSSFQKT